jgi:hypothetical protein
MSLPGVPRLNYRVKATSNALEFWWQAPLNDGGKAITGYNLWCSSIPYSTIIGSSTFYAKASSLTNSQDYVFQLAAINTVGTGAFTNYEIAQPGIISQNGVTNLAVSTLSGTTANVVWAFSNGVNEARNKFFAITMYPSSPTATMSTFRVAAYANQRSAIISGLSTNFYTFLVQPINDAGWYFPNVSTLHLIVQTPIPLRVSGLQVWVDGEDPLGTGAVPANGSTLSTWFDKSGNANNLGTVAGTGTFASNSLNGKGTVTFNGSTFYRAATGNAPYPITVFIIVRVSALNRPHDVCGVSISTGDNFNSLTLGEHTSNRWHNGSSGFSRTPLTVSSTEETSTNFLLMGWAIADNNFSIMRNGVQISQTGSYTWAAPANDFFQIGARTSSSTGNNLSGSVAEVLVYNYTMLTQDRQFLEGYLAWKWGIQGNLPAGHPYLSVGPT